MTENDSKNTSEAKVSTSLDAHIEEAGKADKIKIPSEMPVLPVRDTVIFPSMVAALSVFTERDLKLLNHVLAGNRFLALVAQKEKEAKVVKQSDLYGYATAAVVLQMIRMPDNSAKMLVQGIRRIRIDEYTQTDPYFKAKVTVLEDTIQNDMETEGHRFDSQRNGSTGDCHKDTIAGKKRDGKGAKGILPETAAQGNPGRIG